MFFSLPKTTIEEAKAVHQPELFNPAAIFQRDDGQYVMSLLRDMNWPPTEGIQAVETLTGYKAVACCDPLLSVWKTYPF